MTGMSTEPRVLVTRKTKSQTRILVGCSELCTEKYFPIAKRYEVVTSTLVPGDQNHLSCLPRIRPSRREAQGRVA